MGGWVAAPWSERSSAEDSSACIAALLRAQNDSAAADCRCHAAGVQKAGLVPTGILANVSRAAGYGNVSQLLAQVRHRRCH